MTKNCVVFCGGDPVSIETVNATMPKDCFKIAADKGYELMHSLGLEPDLIIGDFDSAPKPDREDIIVFPVEKDDTDLTLALKEGLSRGYEHFDIYGVTGGRLDHMLSAVQALDLLVKNNAVGRIVDDNTRICLRVPGEYQLPKLEGYSLSLLAFTERVEGLCVEGTKYTGHDLVLEDHLSLGVSNCVVEDKARVSFKSGKMLVVRSKL